MRVARIVALLALAAACSDETGQSDPVRFTSLAAGDPACMLATHRHAREDDTGSHCRRLWLVEEELGAPDRPPAVGRARRGDSAEEIARNPRSRSAKLRAIRRPS